MLLLGDFPLLHTTAIFDQKDGQYVIYGNAAMRLRRDGAQHSKPAKIARNPPQRYVIPSIGSESVLLVRQLYGELGKVLDEHKPDARSGRIQEA